MKILISINIALALVLGLITFSFFTSTKKIVYINTAEVFSEFRMTKELDKEVKAIENDRKSRMDSLNENVRRIQAGIIKVSEEELMLVRKNYLEKQNQFSNEITNVKQASTEKIWKQINQYVNDFGKEKNLDIILGANGQGSLMFAKEKIDITKDLITYINEKYSGN